MAVVRGQADAYVHGGGQYEWDSAAPVAVASAAGLHTSRLDGSPLRYNQPDPWLPDLLICRPELADQLLAALAELPSTAAPSRPNHGESTHDHRARRADPPRRPWGRAVGTAGSTFASPRKGGVEIMARPLLPGMPPTSAGRATRTHSGAGRRSG
ncbi:inositol monophosphatase family protein [Blastococcus brunescens]|uniref:Inositol monophosphatase family protein n=1 Tax=Blastococcus brunescens TaxID=1564165 RepID=A0ABZ1B1R9_9ACTN|nr:inositol monophosphatase family protein [Blastococcus sp. BMG 8361]WRL64307.1 inositol monophosphatase family protein [Blastococcus sp. BMG 8361]